MDSQLLQERLKKLAYQNINICEVLPRRKIVGIMEHQIFRSLFSAATNSWAACKAQPFKAFTSKLSIAFEEIDETLFWLEAISDLNLIRTPKLGKAIKETDELTRVLAA